MQLSIACPNGERHLQVPTAAVGRKVRCSGCQSSFIMTMDDEEPFPTGPFPAQADAASIPAGQNNFPTADELSFPNDFLFPEESNSGQRRKRTRAKSGSGLEFVFILFDLIAGGGYWAWKSGWRLEQPSQELSIAAQTIPELRPFRLKLQHSAGDTIQRWKILDGPGGAKIDAATGEFAWTPTEDQGPGNTE